MTLRLALPSKGRLMEQCFAWFAGHGIAIGRDGAARTYAAVAEGLDGLEVVLASAAEVPQALAEGRVHLGVTGSDLVREGVADWAHATPQWAPMGFGHADLVLAVPAGWIDVATLDDLDAAAAAFRATHGHRLRIATKYHRLTRDFLRRAGVADYVLVDSQGATEGSVRQQTAEAVADITSTGETLAANHLRVLDDGVIHRSQATLFAARAADWSPAAQRTLGALAARIGLPAPEGLSG